MPNKRHVVVGVAVAFSVLFVLLVAGTVSVSATSVSMDFQSEYDGDQETSLEGREISVSGEIRIEESNAVDPTIRISATDQTVMDQETFDVNVDPGLDVNQQVTEEGFLITADEIPNGNSINVEFSVYPRGTEAVEITSATARADFETPGGVSESEEQEITTTLEGGPQDTIQQLQNRVDELEGSNGGGLLSNIPWTLVGGAVAAIILVLVIIAAIDNARD